MNFKKLLALLTALVMTLSLCGCGEKNENTPAVSGDGAASENIPSADGAEGEAAPMGLFIDGKQVDTENLTIMTVDGIDVPFDEYRYIYKFVDMQYFSGGSSAYWEAHPEVFPDMLDIVEAQVMENLWGVMLANRFGVTLNEDDEAQIDAAIEEQVASFESHEAYEEAMAASGINEDLLRRLVRESVTGNRAYEDLFMDPEGELRPTDDQIREGLKNDYVRVYHVLVSNDHFSGEEGYEDADEETLKAAAKEYAEELLERIKNGEDIYTLAQEADDPGMVGNPDGYLFSYGVMVEEFEEASFALEVGEVSDLVETDYGYHIIQRLEQEQYAEDNWDKVSQAYVTDYFNNYVNSMLENAEVTYWEDYGKITAGSIN